MNGMKTLFVKDTIAIRRYVGATLATIAIASLLGVLFISSTELAQGEMSVQWLWMAKTSLLTALSLWIAKRVYPQGKSINVDFYTIIIWILIVYAGSESVLGWRQLYGFAFSNHSLYSLTGSFFNPGPYSGYLVMALPLCLHEWLYLNDTKRKTLIQWGGYYLAGGVMLLILCVLPAGMSRSAWLAGLLSSLWVCSMHYSWYSKLRASWAQHRKRVIGIAIVGFFCLLLGGMMAFHLKKDSANGRLFMWKISCQAIAERPMTGYGHGNFSSAYGTAQEAYFAAGDYTEQEELVAGSPEYAFNEYLQVAIEWGILALLCLLLFIGFCLWRGIVERKISACGGIISLMVFAFSSYPMQLPAFIISLIFLLAVCVVGRSQVALSVFAFVLAAMGISLWKINVYEECKGWTNCRMLYAIEANEKAKDRYEKLYPTLKNRGAFLFEYGHCLHKLKEYDASNKRLKEATNRSCDPMILNVIGKNYQQQGNYMEAEKWLIRSTHLLPGRIYPYYLLVKLYAEPNFYQPDKLEQMADVVLTKEPKVQSTAVKEMREEVKRIRLKVYEIK